MLSGRRKRRSFREIKKREKTKKDAHLSVNELVMKVESLDELVVKIGPVVASLVIMGTPIVFIILITYFRGIVRINKFNSFKNNISKNSLSINNEFETKNAIKTIKSLNPLNIMQNNSLNTCSIFSGNLYFDKKFAEDSIYNKGFNRFLENILETKISEILIINPFENPGEIAFARFSMGKELNNGYVVNANIPAVIIYYFVSESHKGVINWNLKMYEEFSNGLKLDSSAGDKARETDNIASFLRDNFVNSFQSEIESMKKSFEEESVVLPPVREVI